METFAQVGFIVAVALLKVTLSKTSEDSAEEEG